MAQIHGVQSLHVLKKKTIRSGFAGFDAVPFFGHMMSIDTYENSYYIAVVDYR